MRAVVLSVLLLPSVAFAQACWAEWDYMDHQLIRAGQCSENVSIRDFEKGFCKVRVEGDTLKTARSCPQTVKSKEGLNVVTHGIVAKCLNIAPPMAGGKAHIYYYGGKSYTDSRESLRDICKGFEGQWVEGALGK